MNGQKDKKIFFQLLRGKTYIEKVNAEDNDMPDFYLNRKRDVWVMADVNYTASTDFITENRERYLVRPYLKSRNPIIAYVSLYDTDGNECEWTNGGHYTAKIHYGSVLPGQKMEIVGREDHNSLVEILFNSFKNLNSRLLSCYLHKDLDFRSCSLTDPIITKKDFLVRTENVMRANKKAKKGPVKPELVYDDQNEAMIVLKYPDGQECVVKVQTELGYITSINIENMKK